MAHSIKSSAFVTATSELAHTIQEVAARGFKTFMDAMERSMEANSRSDKIQKLNLLTDRELADQYGINRDQIVAYVFRDRMF